MRIKLLETILFVNNQERSCDFYSKIFRKSPDIHVPGMTEFNITDTCKLGLMPEKKIIKILEDKTPNPQIGNGIPRCELYFYVDDIKSEYKNALNSGATLINEITDRDWGDRVCYFADPDGHILAFAEKIHGR